MNERWFRQSLVSFALSVWGGSGGQAEESMPSRLLLLVGLSRGAKVFSVSLKPLTLAPTLTLALPQPSEGHRAFVLRLLAKVCSLLPP